MQVAIIHDWLTGMRGGELVLDSLLKLFPQAELFTLFYTKGKLNERIENRKIHVAFTDSLPFKEQKYRYYLPLFPTAIETFDLRGFDLVISSSHCVAKGIIPDPRSKHITYIHSPMRYVWDLYYDYFPEKSGIKFFLTQLVSNYLRNWDVSSSARVDSFTCNSKFIASRIQKFYRRDSTVVYPPCLPEGFQVISEKKEDYYLIVSAFAPYKRIDLAIEAFRKNGRRLLIIGSGQAEKKLKQNVPKNIEFLGGLSRKETEVYFKKAKAFIFPGLEDFGITPVESQGYATPVIAYGSGGATETVVDGKTGILFSEQTVDSLNQAILKADKIDFSVQNFQKNINRFTENVFLDSMQKQVQKILK
ncbi:MAG: glycosyltransferase [Leptospiraceae bacterium]|nr:glycosyltransferase [Leptospiraceae bacterium]